MSSERDDTIGATKIKLTEVSRHEWEQKGDAIRSHMGVAGLQHPFSKLLTEIPHEFEQDGHGVIQGKIIEEIMARMVVVCSFNKLAKVVCNVCPIRNMH